MAGGPITAMIMHPVVKEELLREAHLQRLERTCRLVDGTPFRNFDALGEQSGRVQVLITSWGCPPIDRAVVAGMPGLKLIAHLAGSVKGFIDDSVWRRTRDLLYRTRYAAERRAEVRKVDQCK